MKKRFTALLLVFSMIIALLSPAACKEVSAAVTSNDGNFYHASDMYLTEDFKAKYYYMDQYFAKSATEYQNSLATMSMCLSMSAFRSNRAESYADKAQNLKALFEDCGFSNIDISEGFKISPSETTTGAGIASKKIKVNDTSFTLIAVAISGGGIEQEWSGAFRLGTSGNAQNVQNAANDVYEQLKDYVADQGISGNVKLWITGYGVGAGKANLLAGKISDSLELGDVTLKQKNVYAYCFQTPKFALKTKGLKAETYDNIFNIINPYNIITHLAPDAYNFGRYGVEKFTPTENGTSDYAVQRDAMLEKMYKMSGSYEYKVDSFQMKEINITGQGMVGDSASNDDLSQFNEQFIEDVIASCAANRTAYVNSYEDDFADFYGILVGNPDDNWMNCLNQYIEIVNSNILTLGIQMILGNESKLADLFESYAWDAINATNVQTMTNADVERMAEVLAKLSCDFAVNHPNMTVTLFYNMMCLFSAHEPIMNLAWLQTWDDNYNGAKFTNEITASNISKTVSSEKRTVAINAKAKGDAELTYKSNNSNITVNSNGKVTIKKNYVGKATITITAGATNKYKKTTKKITVTVKPVKAKITSLKYSNKKIILKNKKNIGSVKYQIQYATNSSFNNSTKTEPLKYNSEGYAVSKPKTGKTYYFRIRGVKTVNDVKYYGTWSDTKTIKIK